MVYFGLNLGTGYLPGSPHLNLVISALVELSGKVILFFILEKTGRRRLLGASFAVTAVTCALVATLDRGTNPTIIIMKLIKCGWSISYGQCRERAIGHFPTSTQGGEDFHTCFLAILLTLSRSPNNCPNSNFFTHIHTHTHTHR